MTFLRLAFQWGVSLILLGLALLYLASVAQFFLFTHTPETANLTYRDAGVNFSIAVALFGLAGVNFWVFADPDLPETPPDKVDKAEATSA